MKKYFKLLRVKHYLKNFLIFIPIIFSKDLFNVNLLINVVIAFISFCLIASTIYIVNDIRDVEEDRKNPSKKDRPIASGAISVKKATIIAIVLFVLSLASLFTIGNLEISIKAMIYVVLYFVLNLGYSFGLKNKPIIDIIILVSGFVIRVMLGGVVANIEISNWLYLTILSISTYLGLGKRRNELRKNDKLDTRKVLKYYNKEFLDKNMYMCMSLAICFFSLWTMQNENKMMIWSVPMVIVLALCYSLDIEKEESYGDPIEVIMSDKKIILLGVLYIAFTFFMLYM